MITGHSRVFAVVGHPVAHSLSPALHNRWFAAHGVDAVYVALDLASAAALAPVLRGAGLAGLNVTAPLRRAARDAADALTPSAEATDAVNTLFRVGDRWVGDNTDVAGFIAAVGELPPGPVAVLGAGGAARAVSIALRALGADDVVVLARARSRAEAVAATIGARTAAWEHASFADAARRCALVVNCTSPGATPELRRWIASVALAASSWFDLNYFDPALPGATDPGLRMLAGQAAAAFERFTGIALETAEVDEARQAAVPRDPLAC